MKRLIFLSILLAILGACSGKTEEQDSSKLVKTDAKEKAIEADSVSDTSVDTVVKQPSSQKEVTPNPPAGIPHEEAKELFRSICMACHGADGEGIVGPNLTDEFWIKPGTREGIVSVIRYGITKKGMPGFTHQCTMEELYGLADYILQLPPKAGKEPQGIKR